MITTANNSLLSRWAHELWLKWYFKFVLPRIEQTVFHGVQLHLAQLPARVRNRILNVGYEDDERIICEKMLKPDDTVMELGGGIGFIGIYCRKILGIKEHICVEANPETVEVLRKNYQLNRLEPKVWNMAVGPHDGEVHFNVSGAFWEHHISKTQNLRTVSVPCKTLSSLLRKASLPISALIIDIEGAEEHLDFVGLPSEVKTIIMEIHRSILSERALQRIFRDLKTAGFRTEHCRGETYGFSRI